MRDPNMPLDFDQPIDRRGTHATKFDDRMRKFGSGEVMPLWIADMDFAAPACVTEALVERARHPVYGYTTYPESLFQAFAGWCARRHRWTVERDWLLPASGVLATLCAATRACTVPGDAVIVQPPVYGGFFQAAQGDGRCLLFNPLREVDGRYAMDLAGLERCAQQGARALLLCNPHNPLGRAWTRDGLGAVLAIARRHGLAIVSDEVHGDLALPGATHLPLGTLARADDRVITLASPSKTFNLQGLAQAMLVVPER